MFRDLLLQPETHPHAPEEQSLKERGLYSISGYLSYWTRHNQTVLETVPQDRLLVVRTDLISRSVDKIAAFAGLPAEPPRRNVTHAFKARAKFDVLDEIDDEYLNRKVHEHCGSLMKQFFPEIHSKSDALGSTEAVR